LIAAKNLLDAVELKDKKVRLLGITTSNFSDETLSQPGEGYQGKLFF